MARTRFVRVRLSDGRYVTRRVALGAANVEYTGLIPSVGVGTPLPPPTPPTPPPQKRMSSLQRLAYSVRGTSLGDDTVGAMPPIDDQAFKTAVLANQRELITAHKTWADGDKLQKWIAIGVTASIPLFGVIWRKLGVGRRGLRR